VTLQDVSPFLEADKVERSSAGLQASPGLQRAHTKAYCYIYYLKHIFLLRQVRIHL
jgi:hypothetical protein